MKVRTKRLIYKYYEYLLTKFSIIWSQKKFRSEGTRIKYILKKEKNSDVLAVVLSSCTRRGVKARYNYLKTLKSIHCNKLFVLDDFAEDHRGAYYLGENLRFNEETAVNNLVKKTIDNYGTKKIIFCGSSKGGYSALNFGLEYENAYIIVGAPQYYLGEYLIDSGNIEAYRHIVGNKENNESKELLNVRLKNKILDKKIHTQTVYLHFSNQEHTYEEHVKFLLEDLVNQGYEVITDIADYKDHNDIALFFPDFLKEKLEEVINI